MKHFAPFLFLLFAITINCQPTLIQPPSSNYRGFGNAVFVDECYAIVGSPNAFSCDGAAFIYVKEEGHWIEKQILRPDVCSYFGNSVVINDKYAVVGSFYDSPSGKTNSGSAFIYKNIEGEYQFLQKIVAEDGERGDQFGFSVTMNDQFIIIGTQGAGDKGAVYVYELDNDIWVLNKKITPPENSLNQLFGLSIDMTDRFIAVGDIYGYQNYGSVLIYEIQGSDIVYHSTILASDRDKNDYFGYSVDLSNETLIIGSLEDSDAAWECGSAYIFELTDNKWKEKQKLIPEDGVKKDRFGWDVAISDNIALVGCKDHDDFHEDAGAVYKYIKKNESWEFVEKFIETGPNVNQNFGQSISLNEFSYMIGESGAANIYNLKESCNLVSNQQEINVSVINMYPNPTQNQLTLEYNDLHIYNAVLISVSGISFDLKPQSTNGNTMLLNLHDYPRGWYTLRIITDKGKVDKKLILE